MRPLELTLTGFRGIRSGLGLKTLKIDFTRYRGLVALVGENGRGKTTVLSNMHHYRLMPDRVKKYTPKAFSFYDETYGNDASKVFISEMDGGIFKSVLAIDAARRKQEAYLYRLLPDGSWEPYGGTGEGKLDTFDAAVEKLFGSPRMFFTSIFRSQKAASLSSYTRSEMMDIFAELIDVEDHKDKKDSAGDIVDGLLSRRSFLVSEKDKLDLTIAEGDRKNAEMTAAADRLTAIVKEIAADDESLRTLEASLKDLEIKDSLQAEALKRKDKLTSDISSKDRQLTDLRALAVAKKREYETKYAAKKEAKEKAGKRLPAVLQEITVGDESLKALEASLKDLEIKGSLQTEALKRKDKLTSDISSKDRQLTELRASLLEKHNSFNRKCKEKSAHLAACEDLVKKAPELEMKAAEEAARTSEMTGLREAIKSIDGKLSEVALMLRGVSVAEADILEAEKTLQRLRLAQTHAVQMAETALKRALESARTLEDVKCVFPEKAAACRFVKAAACDRDSLPSLEEALCKAGEPDAQEKVLEDEIARLRLIAATRKEIEQQEKDLQAKKASLLKSLDAVDKTLSSLREDLKARPRIEQAKVDLPLLTKECEDLLREGSEVVADIEKRHQRA